MQIQPTKTYKFDNYNDVKDFTQWEHTDTSYVDIPDRMMMWDAENFNEKYLFNEDGIKSLFYATGVNGLFPCMEAVEDNQIVSSFVSKLFTQESVKKKLETKQLVVQSMDDRPEKTIIGVVGKQYNKVSNHMLLEKHNPPELDFERGFCKNTTMNLDFTSETTGLMLKDDIKDKVKIGQRWVNDMRGHRKLSFELFVLTLACTNGMMMKSRSSGTSFIHRGNHNIYRVLDDMHKTVTYEYDRVKSALSTLFRIPASNETMRTLLEEDAPLGIIKPMREKKLYTSKRIYDSNESKSIDFHRSLDILQKAPEVYGGAVTKQMWNHEWRDGKNSMFQWLGAFTEYAQTQKPDIQSQIEEDAGLFVEWMHKRKNKFSSTLHKISFGKIPEISEEHKTVLNEIDNVIKEEKEEDDLPF